MTKTMILPLIAVAALFAKNIFGIDIGTDLQNGIADGVLAVVGIWGVYKNHKKDLS